MPDLHLLFNPRSIAVIGASDKPASIGARVLANLLDHSDYRGRVHLVSATRSELRGRPCYPNVLALPEVPDVAVVVVPASAAIEVLEQCAARGVMFAVVLTSGFSEAGPEGQALEARMREIASGSGMRIYGPNCPGVCNVNARLGLTFSPSFPHDLQPGPLGIATQGGGLGRNVMQAMDRGIGVALWTSSGNEVDLQVADFIAYMAEAPDIRVIVTLIEGIKDGARFVQAVRKAARNGKPVVALKVGRSEYGQRAAASHTASITGSAQVNSAAFRQLGVIEVDDIDELVDVAWLLARQQPPAAGEVAVYCSSGGAAALTADIIGQEGVRLATFEDATTARLAAALPPYVTVGNPVDTTAAVLSDDKLVDATLQAVCDDPNVALVLLPITIEYGAITDRIAECAVRVQKESRVPILPIWMSDRVGASFATYAKHGMVPSRSVGKAIKAVRRWLEHGRWRAEPRHLEWEPWPVPRSAAPRDAAPLHLTEAEAKSWLAGHGIPVPANALARSRAEAIVQAQALGFPVVAKVASSDIAHKTDVGGVVVGLKDAEAVGRAWDAIHANVQTARPDARIDGLLIERMATGGLAEVLVGVSRDPVFGHVLTFGLGGIHVELFKDVSRRLLPLSREEAHAMIREVRSFALLDGARGRPKGDVEALAQLLVQVSDFVGAHAEAIDEIDLNPVWVGAQGQGVLALDAVVVGREPAGGRRVA